MIAEYVYNSLFPHDFKQGELLNDPNIAYMQCHSTPLIMNTETNAVINMICNSTEDIWDKAMAQGCAMGGVAPLVGHNAFLRKSALDKAAGRGNVFDGRPWSESHVSEDFELMMR
jgi:Glycosyl transferase family group 2